MTQFDKAHPQIKWDVLSKIQDDLWPRCAAQKMALADARQFAQDAQKTGIRATAATRPSLVVQSDRCVFSGRDVTLEVPFYPYTLPEQPSLLGVYHRRF